MIPGPGLLEFGCESTGKEVGSSEDAVGRTEEKVVVVGAGIETITGGKLKLNGSSIGEKESLGSVHVYHAAEPVLVPHWQGRVGKSNQ